MGLPFVEDAAHQIDVFAQGIDQVGEAQRHMQLHRLVFQRIEPGCGIRQPGAIEMVLQVIPRNFSSP